MSLTKEEKEIIKATAPVLKENGKEITSIFYKHLFANHPELLNIFNQTNQKIGTQPLALANTIYFAAENIDNLNVLMPQILHIAHKHRALTVQAEHYPIVGKYLILAIEEFLGENRDASILHAWKAAYDIIASIFIEIEKKLYDELGSDERNKGFIPLTIVKKVRVANGPIVAFTLQRSDGGKLPSYHSGQYITLRIKYRNYFHNRHYSLTQPSDGKTYRIAIKQEIDHEPKGIVSNEIINNYRVGEKILASFPAGTFALIDNAKHYLFIAGGTGITVLSAMIEQLHKQGQANRVTLIHCVPTEDHAAFAYQMRLILSGKQYHLLTQGKRLLHGIIQKEIQPETHVYLCGSVSFMNKVEEYLSECHHPTDQIHTESFVPSLSLIKNAVKDQANTKIL